MTSKETILETKLAAILYSRWKYKASEPGRIKGNWGEDNTSYLIQAPNQLCEQIVLMQNLLVDKLDEINNLKKELNAARNEVNDVLLF